jgi:hypothetical protein
LAEEILPPFSARNRGAHAQIDNDCPETTRIGLIHLVHRLVDQKYVSGWGEVNAELQRIARVRPDHSPFADDAEQLLLALPWEKVFDFCERLYGHLARDVVRYNKELEENFVVTSRNEIQEYIAGELRNLFLEEHLAFEHSNGLIRRRGRRHTADRITRAELVLGDPRLSAALGHFNKALRYFRNVSQPDHENTVKEAVCAVEATARALFPDAGKTLGEVVKSITGKGTGQLPKPIAQTFEGIYGFRSGGEGVGHGGATGGSVTKELAEYCLALAASQIVLLVDLSIALESEVPF